MVLPSGILRILFLWLFRPSLVSSEVNITTVGPFRVGTPVNVTCKFPTYFRSCTWQIDRIVPPLVYAFNPTSSNDGTSECVAQAEATEDLNGSYWVCKGSIERGGEVVEQCRIMFIILSEPSVSLRLPTAPATVIAGKETVISCVMQGARPVPNVVWKIGGFKVERKYHSEDVQVGQGGKGSITSTLKRKFAPEDNSKTLQCIAEANWQEGGQKEGGQNFRKEDKTSDRTILDVQFLSILQDAIIYNFEENKPGEVQITVHANPRPHRALWILPTPSADRIEVKGKIVDDIVANNYVGRLGEDNGNGTYTYRLNIISVQPRDGNSAIKFQVTNLVGTEQYSIWPVTHPPPKPNTPTEASSGSTARSSFGHWQTFFCSLMFWACCFIKRLSLFYG